MLSASGAEMTASTGTSAKSAIFSRISRAQRALRPAHDDVGRDTDAAELLDRVLRRLGLELARHVDVRHQRAVDVHDAVASDLVSELPDRLEERQALDVAHGAADLGDDDVDVRRVGRERHPALDLVGHVRDHLHRRAEVLALALAADDLVVDRAGRVVRVAREELVDEALVVAEVEVGLGAVLGHEHLAVLERAHRPRVDVDVGVELLEGHAQPARLQEPPERRRGDPLAQRRDDAPGHEHVLDLPAHARPFPS